MPKKKAKHAGGRPPGRPTTLNELEVMAEQTVRTLEKLRSTITFMGANNMDMVDVSPITAIRNFDYCEKFAGQVDIAKGPQLAAMKRGDTSAAEYNRQRYERYQKGR